MPGRSLGPYWVDNAAKSAVLEAYIARRPELKRFLVGRFRDDTVAEDILQEMYLKLERATVRAPIENVGAFLYRTANNLALDHRKAAMRRKARDQDWSDTSSHKLGAEMVADAPDADTALDAKRKLMAIVKALDDLPPQCRRVFIAHKFEGLSYREVAEKMGVTKKTIEKHMSKALKFLVQHLKDMD